MKKKYLLIILLHICVCVANGAIKVTANAPSQVAVGDQFRLQYSVNSAVASEPHLSSINGFKVVYGPATSSSQSYQSINGHVSHSASTSFTFTLIAEKEGTYILPSVTLSIGGNSYSSNKPRIKVVKAGTNTSSKQTTQSQTPSYNPNSSSTSEYHKISPSELYITTTASKHEVYEQEPLLLSYNVYTNLMLEQLQGKMPDLKGFVAKEIPLPKNKHLTVTRHNGRTTQTTTWSQYVMFPQQSGRLTVPSIKFDGTILFPNRDLDPVDAFFFGTNAVTRVNHSVNAPAVNIVVKPLPTRPVGFGGAVGHGFTLSSKILTKDIKENETFNLQLVISGVGNIDLISPPEVEFPTDFDVDDPTTNANTQLTTEGLTGQLVINYPATPNHKGTFSIPPIKFIYFDPQDAKYHTISTNHAIKIDVKRGTPNSYAARQRLKDNDIRNIHTDKLENGEDSVFWLGGKYWLISFLLLAMIVIQPIIIRYTKKLKDGGGVFSLLANHPDESLPMVSEFHDNPTEFYKQLLEAFKGFIAKRTSLNTSSLSAQQINEILLYCHVSQSDIDNCMNFISQCELYAYGVSDNTSSFMNELYLQANTLMRSLRKQLKKAPQNKKKYNNGVAMLFVMLLAIAPLGGFGQNKAQADSLYEQHHYQEALVQYKSMLKSYPTDPNLLYNVGNCYYRTKHIPEAILSYERALRFAPADGDIRHNLTIARAKTEDKFYSASDLELVYSFNSFVNIMSVDGWAWTSITCLLIVACIVYCRRLFKRRLYRNVFTCVIVLAIVGIITSNVFAYLQYLNVTDRSSAIVMKTTSLRSTPDTTATSIFTLHGGTKVTLTDTTLSLWSEALLPDGRKGWISNSSKENI